MNDKNQQNLSELELEFAQELKGDGSLSPHLVRNSGISNEESSAKGNYIGYDIRPEDLEFLYFECLGVPRWESIEAETNEQKTDIYWESFNKILAAYPQISRVRDTDQKIEFNSDEVSQLNEEFAKLLPKVSDEKAIRAIYKFTIACNKAAEQQTGLALIPSH